MYLTLGNGMSRKNTYYLKDKKISMINLFVGIAIFVFILSPFIIMPLRYQIGEAFSMVINGIGNICITVGSFCFIYAIIGIFLKRGSAFRPIIVGVVLLWIGAWCTGAVINFFGIPITGPDTTGSGSGYY